MFKIIVTVKNHRTGKTTVETCRRRYKTYRGAEKAAQGMQAGWRHRHRGSFCRGCGGAPCLKK